MARANRAAVPAMQLAAGRRGRGPARLPFGLLLACALALPLAALGRAFLPASPSGLLRLRRTHLHAVSEEEELQALLAQAEALRQEAQKEEERLRQDREKAAEQAKAEAEASGELEEEEEIDEDELDEEEERLTEQALDMLSDALDRLEEAELSRKSPDELEAAREQVWQAQLIMAKLYPPEEPKYDRSAFMSEGAWQDLAQRWENLRWQDQFKYNKNLGPQGRRKLTLLLKGKDPGVCVIPGARVRVHRSPYILKKSFARFNRGQRNGISLDKMARRGQYCNVLASYDDSTALCKFDDGYCFDFPMESFEGFSMEGSQFL